MGRIKILLNPYGDNFDDYDYQYKTWEMEKLKEHMTPNEYEIRILEENQISNYGSVETADTGTRN